MTVRLAPLERNFRALVKRNGVAAPEGPLPKFFGRWFGDKQIFERQGLRRGGTLLIDISSSMDWSWNQTCALIEATPAMTIALYSGHTATRGYLTIIAHSGKLVARSFNAGAFGHGGSNIIDGPALSWLCRQPRPRVWFCDGHVTGIGDHGHLGIREDADRLCRLGAIRRTVDPAEVKRIFTGRSIPTTPPP